MATNEKKKTISKKQFCFLGGAALALLSLIVIINRGFPARLFSFVPNFLFGAASMGLYVVLYLIGMLLIFKSSIVKIKWYHVIGFIILLVGSCSLIAAITNKADMGFQTYLNDFFKENYLINKDYSLYAPKVSDGLIGRFIIRLILKNGNLAGAYLISIALIILGLAIVLFDLFKFLAQKNKNPRKKKEARNSGETELITTGNGNVRIQNVDPVRDARHLNLRPANENFEAPQNYSQQAEPLPPQNNQSFVSSNSEISFQTASGFAPARFIRSEMNKAPQVEEPVMNVEPEPVVQEEIKEVASEPEPTHREQLTLNFEENNTENVQNIPQPSLPPRVTQPAPKPAPKPTKWISPSSELLEVMDTGAADEANINSAEERKAKIEQYFADFNIGASIEGYTIGPSVTRFHVRYNSNVSSRSLLNSMNDIAIRLGGVGARFEQVVEGESYSGIEVQNEKKIPVTFKDVYEKLPDVKKHPLAIAFGKNVRGDVVWADFNEFPHALLAGTTGSGKSIFINSVITTLIMRNSPDAVKLVLIDPKRIELSRYRDIPHLLCPVINEPSQAKLVMSKLVDEMNDRYVMFEGADNATSLNEYNEYAEANGLAKLPYIVAIVDEFGDLVAATNKEISPPIVLLGQKARACGIHMLIATQRPSVDVITGVIKANLPTHIALCTGSSMESQVILGEGGAERLLGKGDMLVQSPVVSRSSLVRLQGCFIQKQEISRVNGYLKEHYQTIYNEKFMNLEEVAKESGNDLVSSGAIASGMDAAEDEKYQSVKEWVMCQQYMSMSKIQGDCQVGFNRARRFFNRLQQEGVVGKEVEGNKGCRVLMHDANTEINDDIPTSDEITSVD